MDVNDYLLPTDGLDWGEILAPWTGLIPDEFTLWFANCYGEPVLVLDDGTVHRLDFEGGVLERLADDKDAFNDALGDPENCADWLMIPLVDEVRGAGLEIGPGQSYGFATPTVVGGEYDLANTRVVTLAAYSAFLAGVHDKIRGLADGTEIELRIDE